MCFFRLGSVRNGLQSDGACIEAPFLGVQSGSWNNHINTLPIRHNSWTWKPSQGQLRTRYLSSRQIWSGIKSLWQNWKQMFYIQTILLKTSWKKYGDRDHLTVWENEKHKQYKNSDKDSNVLPLDKGYDDGKDYFKIFVKKKKISPGTWHTKNWGK